MSMEEERARQAAAEQAAGGDAAAAPPAAPAAAAATTATAAITAAAAIATPAPSRRGRGARGRSCSSSSCAIACATLSGGHTSSPPHLRRVLVSVVRFIITLYRQVKSVKPEFERCDATPAGRAWERAVRGAVSDVLAQLAVEADIIYLVAVEAHPDAT